MFSVGTPGIGTIGRFEMLSAASFNSEQLSTIISHAVAPAFLLGAVAALVSILITRMAGITDRIRNLNQIADDDDARAWLKTDIARLERREKLLNHALKLALISGLCIILLLFVGFVFAFLGYRHEPGAGVLFIVALCLLGGSVFLFLQDVRISLSEHDHHH
jgi:Protein of unknown function (DUF2721)